MRVIAGTLKGRALKVPPSVTRPTSSRVREAVFSSLEHALAGFDDLAVLDLYAGSGALAIESLSRGAALAMLVDDDAGAIRTISANLGTCGITGARVVRADALAVVSAPNSQGPFDVVFADPPYATPGDAVERILANLVANGWLADGAVVVVERDAKSGITWPDGFEDVDKRTYGDTAIWYGRFMDERWDH